MKGISTFWHPRRHTFIYTNKCYSVFPLPTSSYKLGIRRRIIRAMAADVLHSLRNGDASKRLSEWSTLDTPMPPRPRPRPLPLRPPDAVSATTAAAEAAAATTLVSTADTFGRSVGRSVSLSA